MKLRNRHEISQESIDTVFFGIVGNLGFSEDGTFSPPKEIELNNWQKISEATGTIVTPANAIDLLGFAGAKYGIDRLDSWKGIGIACASFMADFADGKVARATGTQSELGEALDAAGDKIKLAYALVKIWQLELAPKELLCAVAVQNGLNTGITLADKAINKNESVIHASWAGKRAIFLQQWGIGLNVVGSQMEKDEMRNARSVRLAGNIIGACGVVMGGIATAGYTRTLWRSLKN
ncbi:CDP-alcohol phosphatidyltransferase family protein [Candidatus Saccharibacteria bacterium]|nr:CDP-alcohol phosphatidyltransferase family protein [Candidatus Saccharibacteria bacterium]